MSRAIPKGKFQDSHLAFIPGAARFLNFGNPQEALGIREIPMGMLELQNPFPALVFCGIWAFGDFFRGFWILSQPQIPGTIPSGCSHWNSRPFPLGFCSRGKAGAGLEPLDSGSAPGLLFPKFSPSTLRTLPCWETQGFDPQIPGFLTPSWLPFPGIF